ncbi:hypothetical protein ACFXPM_26645 [Streptomyces sp. NPDC059095]|uniref:hypothetical protein n=1 Tax=Streptomyces sp. NPDC059095 TaxID=3346726 RepID=UPI0036C725F4
MLFSVTTTSRAEVDWITEGVRVHFPEAWAAFRDAACPRAGERLVDANARLLADPDPARALAAGWPGCELVVIDDAGHGLGHPGMGEAAQAALDRFVCD